MRRISSLFAFLLPVILFSACQKEPFFVGGPDTDPVIAPAPLTAVLQGNVFDETGKPAVGATVTVGSKTTTTNANGYFRINGASLDKNVSMVTAEKSGYFKAIRSFSATSGANQVVIKLVKKELAGTINATAGGDVTLSNGLKIALPANGVVVATNNGAYTSTINVYAAYIDPTAADIGLTVPGSFMADNKEGKRVTLESYGMMAVELESTTGQKLQIKSGSTATLTTPIPAGIASNAPASIPLWFVDEQTGLWKEEGSAVKSGNSYVGQVSHFSFWNCDIGIPAVQLSLTLKNSDGAPIVHAMVRIRRTGASSRSEAYGITDSLGNESGLVPKNEALVLEVLDQCYQPFYTQNIGPFTQATNLGTITLSSTGSAVATIKGKLLNCSGAAVTKGVAIISYGYSVRYAAVDASGNFATTLVACLSTTPTYSVVGIDSTTQQQGTITGNVTTPLTNAGNITACGTSAAQYINYTLDGVNYTVSPTAGDSTTAYTMNQSGAVPFTSISGFTISNSSSIYFNFNHVTNTAGTYGVNSFGVQSFTQGNTLVQPFNVVITNFPQLAGEFYEGSLSGTFKDMSNVNHAISVTFRIRRSF